MKIQTLTLAAFGHFSEKQLHFDGPGLHIIYGPNEAGKSSALRGLKALLYGIDERTADNFLHANDKLRVQGCLQRADGHKLEFIRRKGRKNTLLTVEGEVLDGQALAPFLQGVTAELFGMLFAIDHPALVQGGREILEQKGEVGQALFSAALGSHALHRVLAQLDEEANGLFKPAGSKPTINAALKSYTELSREVRAQSLSSRTWDEHRRTLGRTAMDLEKILAKLADHRVAVNRLKRIQRIAPKLTRHRELLLVLKPLADVIRLADDFTQRRQQAVQELQKAQAILDKAVPRRDGLRAQLDGLSINHKLLNRAEPIENFHSRLGGYRRAQQDRPHLDAERQQLLADAERLLKAVRPDLELADVDTLAGVLASRQAITELGNKHAVLVSRVEQAELSRRDMERRLTDARREGDALPQIKFSDVLRRTINSIRKKGDIDAEIQIAQRELLALNTQCGTELSRLTLWNGALEDLPKLGVPGRESIAYFEETFGELDNRFRRLHEKQEEANDNLRTVSQRLDALQRAGQVPTEEDLIAARISRDQTWQLLRRQWLDDIDVRAQTSDLAVEVALPDTFEGQVIGTDELSDRLRREAERVHTLANLQTEKETLHQQTAEITGQLAAVVAAQSKMAERWVELWAPCQIRPRTPREMRAWLDDLEKLRDRAEHVTLLGQRVAELEQTRKAQISRLNQQLLALGNAGSKTEELEPLLLDAEHLVQQLDKIQQKRDGLEKAIRTLQTSLESLNEDHQLALTALDEWQAQWQLSVEKFALQGTASPTEVADFIEKVRGLMTRQGEAEKLRRRIDAIDTDADNFCREVADVVETITPGLPCSPVADAVVSLNAQLTENRTRQTQYREVEVGLAQAALEIKDSESIIRTMTGRLNALCQEAQCDHPAELETAERNSARHFELSKAIASMEQEILAAGEGAIVAQLEQEADGVDPDSLPAQIDALNHKIDEELEPKRTALAQAKGREEKELELMDGSDQAASLAEQAQAVLAGIRADAQHYVRVKLAAKVLRDEIERYRKENQGPLVRRASEHFATLTLDSFKALNTDVNDRDEPVLAGVRPGGERVYVEGMSAGTRDQLYLALRLASLEKYMGSAEPMPFIVDDILVDFDDKRSAAALTALSILAEKTQVILFTHHLQLVEQAKLLPRPACVHSL